MLGSGVSTQKRFLFAILIVLGVLIVVIVGRALFITTSFYWYVKNQPRGWAGEVVFQTDADLGFVPIPDSMGVQILGGEEVPALFDQQAFRVPADDELRHLSTNQPRVLFLGGSFTYGAYVPAEGTFPYLVGQELGGSSMNAGVPSHGLSHILLLARQLIPQHRPDYVVVQYSDWLVDRSLDVYAPSYIGLVPSPFFYESDSEQLLIHSPVFMTKVIDLLARDYRETQQGVGDYLSFMRYVGLPLLIHDGINHWNYKIKNLLGLIPPATEERQKILSQTFRELAEISQENQAILLILLLDNNAVPWEEELNYEDILALQRIDSAVLVDAQSVLIRPVEGDNELYNQTYCHLQGDPPVVIDCHPNALAHEIIAAEIVKNIKALEK